MPVVGQAAVQVFPSFKGFKGAVDSEVKGTGKRGGGLFSSAFAGAIGGGIALVGSQIASGLGSAIGEGIKGAADLEQSIGAVQSIFKESAGQILGWSDTAATSVGLTKNEFNELGSLIGAQLKNGGTAMDELAPKTNDLITLGADLSSMFGGTTADAVGALSSALKGERDPIERYGVSLNQAKIDAEAAALGFEKVGGSLSAEAQQAATLSLIMKQTTDAHGNFAKEADTISGKQQRLNALWNDGKTAIAGAFLPALSSIASAALGVLPPLLKVGESLAGALGEGLSAAVDRIGSAVGAIRDIFATGDFTAAIGEALGVEEDSALVRVLFTVRDAALQVGPALSGLGAQFGAVRDLLTSGDFTGAIGDALNVEEDSPLIAVLLGVRQAAQQVGPALSGIAAQVGPVLSGVAAQIGPILASLGPALADAFSVLGPVIGELASSFLTLAPQISPLSLLLQGIAPVAPVIAQAFVQLATALGSAWSTALAAILPLLGTVANLFGTVLAPLIGQLVSTLLPPLVGIISSLAPVFSALVGAVAPLVQTLLSSLVPVISQLITSLLPVLGTVLTTLGTLFEALAPVITTVIGVIAGVIEALLPVVETVFGAIAEVIGAVMQIVQGIIQVVTGIITGDWNMAFEGLKNIASGVFNAIKAVITGVLNIVVSVIKAAVGIVKTIWTAGFNAVRGIVQSVTVAIASRILGFINGVKQTFTNGWNVIKAGVTNTFNGIRTAITNTLGTVVATVSSKIQEIIEFFTGIPGRVTGALGNLSTKLISAGGDLVRGFISGMTGAIGRVAETARNMASQAIEAAKGALKIASPSRVFAEIGEQTGQGLVVGLDGMRGRVAGAGDALANSAVPGVPQIGISAGLTGTGGLSVKVFIGQRELTDIIGVEIGGVNRRLAEAVS